MIDRPAAGRNPGSQHTAPAIAALVTWTFAALAILAAAVFLFLEVLTAGVPITVTVDGQSETFRTARQQAGAVLADLHLSLRGEDLVSVSPDTPVTRGLAITVVRARPALVSTDGALYEVFTRASDVGSVLAAAGLHLSAHDEVLLGGELVTLDTALPPVQRGTETLRLHRSHPWDLPGVIPLHLSVRRAVPLTVDDGSVPYTIYTTAPTVGEALVREQLSLYLGDRVQPGLGDRVTPGLRVTIERSKPVVVTADGRSVQTRTRGQTVGATLMELGVLVAGNDRVTPALHQTVADNLSIRVTRVRQVTLVEREAIPYESIMVPDDNLEIDSQRLAQEGQDGEFRRRLKVVFEDGQEASRIQLDEWVAAQPVTRKVAYGRKIVLRTLDTPTGPVTYWRKVRMYGVSYSPARSGTPASAPWYGRTRIGLPLRIGLVAVDPKLIPLRSYVYVPDYGVAMAADTGGGVIGKMIDLGYEDHNYRSWHWWTDVYFLDPPPAASRIVWVLPNYPPPTFPKKR